MGDKNYRDTKHKRGSDNKNRSGAFANGGRGSGNRSSKPADDYGRGSGSRSSKPADDYGRGSGAGSRKANVIEVNPNAHRSSYGYEGSGRSGRYADDNRRHGRYDTRQPQTGSRQERDYRQPQTGSRQERGYRTPQTAGGQQRDYNRQQGDTRNPQNDTRPKTANGQSGNTRRREKVKIKFHGGIAVACYVLLYIVLFVAHDGYEYLTTDKIATVNIKNDVIDTQAGITNGVIIRDEQVLYSNGEGEVSFVINDKERVKKGTQILQIRNAQQVGEIEANLTNISETILDTQNMRGDLSMFYTDVVKINSQIKTTVENGIFKFTDTGTADIYEMKDSIAKSMNLRSQMMSSESKGSLKEYFDEKTYYEGELSKYVKTLESGRSGVVSYTVDNMESVYNVNTMRSLTYEQVNMKPSEAESFANTQIEEGKPVAKLVTSNDWYIAAYVDNEYAGFLSAGDIKNLYIQQNDTVKTLQMTVDYVNTGNDTTFMIFKSSKDIIEYMDTRNISFKLSDSAKRGLKIPNSAIVSRSYIKIPDIFVKDGYVFLKTEKGTEKTQVSVNTSKAGEGFVYMLFDYAKFSYGDILVDEESAKEHKLSEGDMASIKGIYRANSKAARFYAINDENILSAGGYSILDPELNSGLNQNDIIVVDGENIHENQVVN
ncbi:MAG: hypothetical protein LBS21_10545 [Clostridiales bacterium]|nr:hypothetical protein [Clostridiales bacterium]